MGLTIALAVQGGIDLGDKQFLSPLMGLCMLKEHAPRWYKELSHLRPMCCWRMRFSSPMGTLSPSRLTQPCYRQRASEHRPHSKSPSVLWRFMHAHACSAVSASVFSRSLSRFQSAASLSTCPLWDGLTVYTVRQPTTRARPPVFHG